MNLKSCSKVKLYKVLIFLIMVIIGGLYVRYQNISSYPIATEKFLRKYYTVTKYTDIPDNIEELNEIKERYSDCLTNKEIERLICNRSILVNSLAAEQSGCTLKTKKINIMPVSNENRTYKYEITIEVNYTKEEQKDITLTGKLYMEDDSKYSLISKYYPDLESHKIFNLLK